MPSLVKDLIESARIRHWSFIDVNLGDGAALLFLNDRQRTHLADHGEAIEGLIGTSVVFPLSFTGRFVAFNTNGVPYLAPTTITEGLLVQFTGQGQSYAVQLNDNGVPYVVPAGDGAPFVDPAGSLVSSDPLGSISGAVQGFPLPSELIRLITVMGTYTEGARTRNVPVDVIPEHDRPQWQPYNQRPMAYLSGNRILPLLPFIPGNTQHSPWHRMVSVSVSYVAMTAFASLADPVTLPRALCEALIADLALLFARQAKDCPQSDRVSFQQEARDSGNAIAKAAYNMLESVRQPNVVFKG